MLFNRKQPIIFIDVDDTLGDTRRAVYDLYVELTGDKTGNISVKSKRYVDFCKQWTDEEIESLFSCGITLYNRIKPIPGAREAVVALEKKGYDVRIATMHNPEGIEAKHKWIKEHFPELEHKVYYLDYKMPNKDVFKEMSLIDDDLKNIKTNQSAKPILLDVYDIYSDLQGYIRCRSWNEVLTKF